MAPIILPDGIVLNPDHAGAQQLQAYAQRIGLKHVHIFWATVQSKYTYLVVDNMRPVFESPSLDAVAFQLDIMVSVQHVD